MAIFKYKRINRGGKYSNAIYKNGKFYRFEKWDKDHHKWGAIERSKIKREHEELVQEEIKRGFKEAPKEYQPLKKALRERIKVNWNKIRSKKELSKILKKSDLAGETTDRRTVAVKKLMNVEFRPVAHKLNMSFFNVKGIKTMRYRNPLTGRFAQA